MCLLCKTGITLLGKLLYDFRLIFFALCYCSIVVCGLCGVALDNAIEAMNGLEDTALQVEMYVENDILMILTRNKVKESVCRKNPNLLSSKTDAVSHGHGITSVKRIAEKYHGSADFYDEEHWFVARIEMDVRCL